MYLCSSISEVLVVKMTILMGQVTTKLPGALSKLALHIIGWISLIQSPIRWPRPGLPALSLTGTEFQLSSQQPW